MHKHRTHDAWSVDSIWAAEARFMPSVEKTRKLEKPEEPFLASHATLGQQILLIVRPQNIRTFCGEQVETRHFSQYGCASMLCQTDCLRWCGHVSKYVSVFVLLPLFCCHLNQDFLFAIQSPVLPYQVSVP
mmetsp:Transcript_68230/g.118848  ORF Transcript_68230/g.118848 Transcript_68230/m.118848 type:complete len:131 (+) Transcript_68230:106-498(+)